MYTHIFTYVYIHPSLSKNTLPNGNPMPEGVALSVSIQLEIPSVAYLELRRQMDPREGGITGTIEALCWICKLTC